MNLQNSIWLYRYLWIAPHVLLLAVAIVMLRKKLYKDFPIFFTYLLFEFVQFCVLFTMLTRNAPLSLYVKIDLFDRAGDIALRFGILQELFGAPLAHNFPMRWKVSRILNSLTVVLVVLAAVSIGSLYSSIFGFRFPQAYTVVGVLNTAQCGVLVLVFLWHRFLGLRMSSFTFGIAAGMGLVVGFEPFMQVLKTMVAVQHGRLVTIVSMAVYHIAVLAWLYFALAREEVTADADAALAQLVEHAADIGRIARL